jgi:hypothetical protein
MNCEKNAVVCEGYPEKQIWKSGRERAEEGMPTPRITELLAIQALTPCTERLGPRSFPSITMQPLFHGLETVEDMIFWKHYNEYLSAVLTVEGEHKNAFKTMMIPIAVKHQGLMHSILSLASKHMDFETPYGTNILRNNPATTLEALRERSIFHHDQARLKFYDDVEFTKDKSNTDKILVSARYGQMLCFLLEALAEGSPRGEHRYHLNAYRHLIGTSPPEDPAFLSFIAEFFQYHIFADELMHSAIGCRNSNSPPKPLLPIPEIHPPRLLGVADGLLDYLPQITAIRNTIRINMMGHADFAIDYVNLYRAVDIDAAIRDWTPHWPPGDNRDRVGLLYKHMVWLYLVRTICPPSASSPPSLASSAVSLSLVHSSPIHGRPTSSVVNTPPQSASTSCASSPKLIGFASGPKSKSSRPVSRLDSSSSSALGGPDARAHANENRADSPPPIRQPPQHDPRVTLAVDESLAILETFKPSDPCQTLLLLPCFLLGTACFGPTQQRRLRAAIKNVRGYTGLRNTDRAVEVLEEIWRLMGVGDWVAVWDWPGIAHRMGLDFIPA